MPAVPSEVADRAYAAWEDVSLAAHGGDDPQPSSLWVRGDLLHCVPPGPEEHRIDAYQLRNEAAFINDWRDNVRQTSANGRSGARRRANAAVVTVLVGQQVHALVWATGQSPMPCSLSLVAVAFTRRSLHNCTARVFTSFLTDT